MMLRRAALLLLVLIGLAACILPAMVNADPLRQNLAQALTPPCAAYLLGADDLGRSVLARLLFGARYSLGIAAGGVAIAVLFGAVLGIAAAVLGGVAGAAVRIMVDAAIALPSFLAALLIAGSLAPGPLGLCVVIAATTWIEPCRVGLLTAMRAVGASHVEAARLAGVPGLSVACRQVAPALLGPLVSVAGLLFGQAILTVASLGFLGVGLRPPTPEWGAMIVAGLPYVGEAPGLIIAPAGAIVLTVAALFLATSAPA